jgi:hypothetical protein
MTESAVMPTAQLETVPVVGAIKVVVIKATTTTTAATTAAAATATTTAATATATVTIQAVKTNATRQRTHGKHRSEVMIMQRPSLLPLSPLRATADQLQRLKTLWCKQPMQPALSLPLLQQL